MTLEDKLKAFYKQVALQEETIANKAHDSPTKRAS